MTGICELIQPAPGVVFVAVTTGVCQLLQFYYHLAVLQFSYHMAVVTILQLLQYYDHMGAWN